MKLKDIEIKNAEALDAIRGSDRGAIDYAEHPELAYYGYYEADIFECPPFLMFTSNDCPRGWDILFLRRFEPTSMKIWCLLAKSASGILDIGAHVGVYSLAAASLRQDIKIHAFEPNPYAFSRLRIHKMVNGFSNIAEHRVAVSNKNGVTNLSWTKKPTLQISSGGALVQRDNSSGREHAVAETVVLDGSGLAGMLGERPLVKVDVEGTEVNAFLGMQEVLSIKPDIILETFSQKSCDAINEMISPLGYKVFKIIEKGGRLEEQTKLVPCQINAAGNFNQFLTVHHDRDIADLVS